MYAPEAQSLFALAAALGAESVGPLSDAERKLLRGLSRVPSAKVEATRTAILQGDDPLGTGFSLLRSPAQRRPLGATYTPPSVVRAMVHWAAEQDKPLRVVDAGVGSGRFLLAAAPAFPAATLVGIEVDPVACLLARANLAAAGVASRAVILLGDYREIQLESLTGPTLFIGNPPYVRHHLIPAEWKAWLITAAQQLGLSASTLAGLHVHFFLRTAALASPGDLGCFITAAEWLDVNYGKLVRDLFLGPLGGRGLVLVDPKARPFPDAASTAVIASFRVGAKPKAVSVRCVADLEQLQPLSDGIPVLRERLAIENRWTHLLRAPHELPAGFVELGELCRVHRGQVTGANRVWIAGMHSKDLPDEVLFPAVTRARELFVGGNVLADAQRLKRIIDLPVQLDALPEEFRKAVHRFLRWARSQGADRTYIALHRRAWWSVGLRTPPPILATYMARRPPAFVLNRVAARYINIAHGIYPREPIPANALLKLVAYLRQAAESARGRTYAGGLKKFEPREMERIPVPGPELLALQHND